MTRRLQVLLSIPILVVCSVVGDGSDSPPLAPRFCIPGDTVLLAVPGPLRPPIPGGSVAAAVPSAECRSGIPRPEAILREDRDDGDGPMWAEWTGPEDDPHQGKNITVLASPAREPDDAPGHKRRRDAEDHGRGAAVAALSDSLLLSRPPPFRSAP